jgi:hypothetical protein
MARAPPPHWALRLATPAAARARGATRFGARRAAIRRGDCGARGWWIVGQVRVVAQRVAERRGVRPAVVGALGEGALDGGRERRRHVGAMLSEGPDRLAQMLHQHRRRVGRRERRRAGEHLVAHHA